MLKTAIHLFPFLTILACDSGTEVKIGTTNSPPSVTMLSPGDGESFNEDSIIHFHAKVSDSYDSPSELTIFWGSDVQGELNSEALPDSLGDLMFSTANLEVGVHVVTLTALDTDGAQTQASVGVEIIDLPEDPTIDVIQPTDEDSAIEGYPFTLLVQTWDARDEFNTLAVTMESDQDGEICQTNPGSNGVAECDALLTAGAHLLTFTVVNSAEYEAQATAYFEVISILDIDDDSDGFTENQGDCDDNDPTVNPSSPEVENGLDDNCNGVTDEGTNAYDDDGDGFSENEGDCNDNEIAIYPTAIETCGNGMDDNCNGSQNEQNGVNCTTYYRDSDADGFGDPNLTECWCQPGGSTGEFTVSNGGDCFDGNASASPNQQSYFNTDRGDGSFDYNCDGTPTKELTVSGSCNSVGSSIGDCTLNTAGWDGGSPSCGDPGSYLYDNDSCSWYDDGWPWEWGCYPGGPSYNIRVQSCR